MKHGDVVLRFLTPADEDSAKPIHPTMRPLDHPTPCLEPGLPFNLLRLFAPRLDVRREAELLHDLTHLIIVVSFIHTHALRLRCRRLGALDGNALQRRFDHLHVVAVGPRDGEPHWHAVGLHEQAALDAFLGAVGGVFAGLFPPQGVPWSCTRPCSTKTSRCLSGNRIPTGRPSTSRRRRPRGHTPGSGRGRWSRGKTWWHPVLSTGSPCARRRRWHPCTRGRECEACRRRKGGC